MNNLTSTTLKKKQVFYYLGHCHQKIIQMHFATIQGQIYSSHLCVARVMPGQGSTWGTTMVYTEGQYFVNCWQLRTTCSFLLSKYWHKYKQITVPYPAVFWGCWFFDECSKEKNHCTTGESGAVLEALPSGVQGQNAGNFWLFCVLNSSKHCSLGSATRNIDKNLHQKSTLFSNWGFEFGIPNQHTSFKMALDTSLD